MRCIFLPTYIQRVLTHRLEDAPKRRLQKMAIAWNLQDVVFSKSVDGSSSHDVNTTMIFKRWPRNINSVLNNAPSVIIIILIIFTTSPSLVIGEDGHEGSSDPLDWLRASIPGEPELDYPILSQIPETSFSCSGRIFGGEFWCLRHSRLRFEINI